MSTPQTTHKRQDGFSPAAPDTDQVVPSEWLSAAADGECPEAGWSCLSQVGARRASETEPDTLARTWMEFHLIGDALRAGQSQTLPAPSSSFASAVMARVAAEQPQWSTQANFSPPPVPAVVATVATSAAASPAANDALFRWKMLAGVASLAAVVAVAWQLTVAPAAELPGGLAGPQLASAPAVSPTLASTVAPRDTVVSTDAGVLLRDPELEAFIAAHRQSGGMSALQMPAGFLRNATFEAPQR